MSDLIKRADAMGAVQDHFNANGFKGYDDGQKMMDRIKALLSADAVSMEEHVKELNDLASAWKNKFINAEKRTEEIYDETMAKVANECKECKERLRNLRPSAEAVQGEWIEVEVFPEVYDIEGVKTWGSEMQCDQCGFRHTAIEGHMAQYNYCPNCGAKMKGGEQNDD